VAAKNKVEPGDLVLIKGLNPFVPYIDGVYLVFECDEDGDYGDSILLDRNCYTRGINRDRVFFEDERHGHVSIKKIETVLS
jgi:hypothetical protein